MNRKIISCLLALLIPSNFYGSVDFDGTDDYFDCGLFALPSNSGAMAAWIKIDSGATVQFMHVISLSSSDTGTFQLSVDAAGSDPTRFATYCAVYSVEEGGIVSIAADCASAQCIQAGQWHHIACVNDGDTDFALTPYIDGVPYTSKPTTTLDVGTGHNLTFGNDVFFGAAYYKGEIADGIFIDGEPSLSEMQTMAFSRMRNYIIPTNSNFRKQFYFPLDDFPDGTSVTSRTFIDRTGLGNSCTGSTGGTARADILRYP